MTRQRRGEARASQRFPWLGKFLSHPDFEPGYNRRVRRIQYIQRGGRQSGPLARLVGAVIALAAFGLAAVVGVVALVAVAVLVSIAVGIQQFRRYRARPGGTPGAAWRPTAGRGQARGEALEAEYQVLPESGSEVPVRVRRTSGAGGRGPDG